MNKLTKLLFKTVILPLSSIGLVGWWGTTKITKKEDPYLSFVREMEDKYRISIFNKQIISGCSGDNQFVYFAQYKDSIETYITPIENSIEPKDLRFKITGDAIGPWVGEYSADEVPDLIYSIGFRHPHKANNNTLIKYRISGVSGELSRKEPIEILSKEKNIIYDIPLY